MIYVCRQLSSLTPLTFATLREYNNKIIGKNDIPRSSFVKIEYDKRNSEVYIITNKNKKIVGYSH